MNDTREFSHAMLGVLVFLVLVLLLLVVWMGYELNIGVRTVPAVQGQVINTVTEFAQSQTTAPGTLVLHMRREVGGAEEIIRTYETGTPGVTIVRHPDGRVWVDVYFVNPTIFRCGFEP